MEILTKCLSFGTMAVIEKLIHFYNLTLGFVLGNSQKMMINQERTLALKHSSKLEEMIAERTAKLQIKTNDIDAMLQNMNQGIFTITRNMTIHPEYSSYLRDIFKNDQIAGSDVMNFLFEHVCMSVDDRNKIRSILQACLGEDEITFMINNSVLPTEINCTIGGEQRVLELAWNPIYDELEAIDKILVNVRDITEFRLLQTTTEEKEKSLEVVHGILAASMQEFELFIKNSRRMLRENINLINAAKEINRDVIKVLFRNMHTVKGNARIFGYHGVTDTAHLAEDRYSQLQQKPETKVDRESLIKDINRVITEIDFCRKACDEQLKSVIKDSAADLKTKINNLLVQYKDDANLTGDDLAELISQALVDESNSGIREVIEEVTRRTNQIASKLGKEPPAIKLPINNFHIPKELNSPLQDALVHCLTNSIDHGIESPLIRRRKGKPAQGKITFALTEMPSNIELVITDDGQGLNLHKVRAKLAETQPEKCTLADHDLIKEIFSPGFSTASSITECSGRGVGLDAVYATMEILGGSISADPTGPVNESGFIPIQFTLLLPKSIKNGNEIQVQNHKQTEDINRMRA